MGQKTPFSILQLFLEIEKTAALRQHWHPARAAAQISARRDLFQLSCRAYSSG